MTTPRATLTLVARKARVSLATASKVLNGRSGVADETRDRVRAAMEELGYAPTTARADEPGAAVTRLTVIVSELDATLYNAQLLQAILAEAAAHECQVIVRLIRSDQGQVSGTQRELNVWARSLLGGGCQGALFVTCDLAKGHIDACERVGLPLLAVDCHTLLDAGVPSISANNFAGGYAQAEHLIGLGHRRIGLVAGLQDSTFARERAHGFRAAMADAGLRLPQELIHMGDFLPETGHAAASEFLALDQPPTAIAANSDGCALGVMAAAREHGLRVPEDLSVIGFDDTNQARWSVPKLTTIAQPVQEIGSLAVRTMLRLISGAAPDSPHLQLATTLVVRESTASASPSRP
ncbi:MAG: LacI family transcriptional regulator [Propionibacteriaceae bacterium]|jgi:LacI family transcriptional regulator|nr:LacI family transcriptional regulator [Propionibacteriaceae bacterium]